MIGLGTYQPNGLVTLTAQPIVDRLMSTLDDISNPIFFNYRQSYDITSLNNDYKGFKLKYKPLKSTMFVLINGVTYYNTPAIEYYLYEEDTQTLYWKFRETPMFEGEELPSNGFDLEEGYTVTITYSFVLSENEVTFDDVIAELK